MDGSLCAMRIPALLIVPCLLAVAGCTGGPGDQSSQAPRPSAGEISQAPADSASPGAVQTPVAGNASPAPSTRPPTGAVTAAALPTGAELTGWREGATGTGGGTDQLSACQRNRWESTGATGIVHRSYTRGADTAAAVALSFDTAELAEQAYQTTRSWFADCTAPLSARGGQARQVTPARPAEVAGGQAEVTEWAWAGDQREAQGLVRLGNRVEVLAIRAPQPLGELERTLPAAARRLPG